MLLHLKNARESFSGFNMSLLWLLILVSLNEISDEIDESSAKCDACGHFKLDDKLNDTLMVSFDERLVVETTTGTIKLCRFGNKNPPSDCRKSSHGMICGTTEDHSKMKIVYNDSIVIHGNVTIAGNRSVVFESLRGNITVNSSRPLVIQRHDIVSYNNRSIACFISKHCGCLNQSYLCEIQKASASIEFKAKNGKILIGSHIIVNARRVRNGVENNQSCEAYSGGTIRLSADQVEIGGNGKLVADGEISAANCSGGSGGVIIVTATTQLALGKNVISVKGGEGKCPGKNGFFFVKEKDQFKECQNVTQSCTCSCTKSKKFKIKMERLMKLCDVQPEECNSLLPIVAQLMNEVIDDQQSDFELSLQFLLLFSKFIRRLIQNKGFTPRNIRQNFTNLDVQLSTGIIDDDLKARIKHSVEIPLEQISKDYGCNNDCNATVFIARMRINKRIKYEGFELASGIVMIEIFIDRIPLRGLKKGKALVKISGFKESATEILKTEPKCQYLDENTEKWSSEGVSYATRNGDIVSCSTGHFTNFAVFFAPAGEHQISEANKLALQFISLIGCGLSLFGVTISLALYVFLRHDVLVLSEDRNIVHVNLMISLGLVQIFFLVMSEVTPDTLGCQVVGIILHYLFVASFVWMFIEGIILYLKVVTVFKGENVHIMKFVIFGWVSPAIFVAIFAAVKSDEYTVEKRCFLSPLTHSIWALLCPALISISINFCIFIAVLYVLVRLSNDDAGKSKIRIAFRGFVILTPMLGFTWLFAVAVMNDPHVFWQYAFCLCNSFQGLMVFLIHGIGNKQIRQVLKRKLFPPDKWNDVKPTLPTRRSKIQRKRFSEIPNLSYIDEDETNEKAVPYTATNL